MSMDEKNIIMDVQDLKKYYPMSKGSFSKGSKKTLKALDGGVFADPKRGDFRYRRRKRMRKVHPGPGDAPSV